ncbi:hypothetical protein [Spirulina sp. 06S082]|uniref:hypothetical protein n=1 Tax=Spirulina sp. 06S082 TaxID=3110248 RepID=UPI002B1EA7CF|nr:hypothetical protein [Spirulina sp. 06S082]MEA5472127.1 hypothetical protein [Spirulina sp. 06S082]
MLLAMPVKAPETVNDWETSLPDSLKNPEDIAKIKQGATQWSRLVAWSWTPCLAFSGDPQKASKEQALKAFYIQILKAQARDDLAFAAYGQSESKKNAQRHSQTLKHLILGENDRIEFLRDRGISVTLSDVCKQLSGLELVTTKYPEFGGMFTYHVVLNKYVGEIKSAIDAEGYPINRQYISEVAYPSRPILGEDTVTELQLSNWIYNIHTGGDYLPPSPYIAFGFS